MWTQGEAKVNDENSKIFRETVLVYFALIVVEAVNWLETI